MKFEQVAKLGAEVSGVDLSPDLPQDLIDEIGQGILEHRVIFFRGQDLSGEELAEFSTRFGESFIQPALAHKYKELLFLENDKSKPPTLNTFHQDMTGLPQPPALHMLHALVVPEGGGDTMWACNYSAYESLSDKMKRILGSLTCTHSVLTYYEPIVRNWDDAEEKLREFEEAFPPVTHPLVRTHPQTGRKSLFINRFFTEYINGFTPKESANLLQFLYQHIETPEFCVRLRWRTGTLAIWDNRCTSHYALADYWPQHRKMQRASVSGDTPF